MHKFHSATRNFESRKTNSFFYLKSFFFIVMHEMFEAVSQFFYSFVYKWHNLFSIIVPFHSSCVLNINMVIPPPPPSSGFMFCSFSFGKSMQWKKDLLFKRILGKLISVIKIGSNFLEGGGVNCAAGNFFSTCIH